MARILVADDAAFMRMMIKNILTQNGHEVVGEAENGQQAVEKFKELGPDICTMDITMPEKDGIEALKEIIAADPQAKVVMCSALGQETKVIESIRSQQCRVELHCALVREPQQRAAIVAQRV